MKWNNKTIFVTGGTGFFGQRFIQILLKEKKPKKIIIFSRDEIKQYEMQKQFKHPKLRFFLGDIRDEGRLLRALQGVDYVIHAAALKIVPLGEYNPFEVIKTNILGSQNLINAAIDRKVEKVLAISTDKAVHPINLYGATKLCTEKMFIAANNYSPNGTRMSAIRYGNVMGSRGSVVPLFKEAREKGVVTITDPRMTRFWMMVDDISRFVIRVIETMKGGEIFVPKLPSIKITDLAKAICPDCKIKVIGNRSGEKIHETLVAEEEGAYTYESKDAFTILPRVVLYQSKRKMKGRLLGNKFTGYRSDTNRDWLTAADLKQIFKQKFLSNQ
ncbi:MAG: UDP-N-acetylglucosamine 4,6-dehydratase (inverting) [Omnitrophica bacterium RIFCSPLOWO2_12_FULL_44_17]|uniref:UDP-N-acetylglucosamine 4,6-dehydratase (Inverting) n=1 Tax=Candidatus Danuiimicrobium aquiferis TaxID=1801832 RepID=A0A1G1L134_9BACT|nr:MAG: UDP-N-acetylglucosamine 4,6-dehydratase (inverting) [Omnitrophica bacterium RIFCSPHIGHO2_02_FULL_45_28]OGW90456.1 MAG: UDP-N-acetylglucosamine 4,6-dehydratase (inverting) [Omnitrophica bacterium RIFCSPHIGHO2_12_FULL_44_12]OGW98841.1 MAG: UDP-N-acetylglucosamine 4,6-dehydratase (inverting) [Omnitrophica bacterium RIFCSPLOWO2_12_FULL_44_17]OGX02802.1 MAG: UDP-N-acetylglucosamine 4,6-dehydratase (inverting) [Omnitrophica bacterium RIFCSPLOWO2_02_FULL_44_11]